MPKVVVPQSVWIGLAKVVQEHQNGALGEAKYGYTNVISWAASKASFRKQVKRGVEVLGLQLLRLEAAETVEERLDRAPVDKQLLKLSSKLQQDGSVGFGTFHVYD